MNRWQFWIDVGGTFTDCIAIDPEGQRHQHKTLSSGVIKGHVPAVGTTGSPVRLFTDPRRSRDPDHVWDGWELTTADGTVTKVETFRHGVLHLATEVPTDVAYELKSGQPSPLVAIRYLLGCSTNEQLPPLELRLGTTRGTNALITRTGARTALVTTAGFGDILRIGYQSRPDLFAVDIIKPDELYGTVVEVNERIDESGKVLVPLDENEIRESLTQLREEGFVSLAIVTLHACSNPQHELRIHDIAHGVGFTNISQSHEVSSARKIVPRGDTTVIDAYLNPILLQYVAEIQSALHPDSDLQLMTSSGALASVDQFRGKDSILSGPAGGVVGVARVAEQGQFRSAIGFDMGGTSTDVSRWDGSWELEYETEKAGVRVVTPMMAIETVAAGGGSLCQFDGVKLTVGPASAGANPGPASYGNGGPLAVTDVNFYLGKIVPTAFPFALDREAVERELAKQFKVIEHAIGKRYTPEQLAEGYLQVANNNMAEAIRCVSVDRGADPRDHVLVAFGGAAGQHACSLADVLGMEKILLHPAAGIMSALGIGLADPAAHCERGIYRPLSEVQTNTPAIFGELEKESANKLERAKGEIEFEQSLDLRFQGLDEPYKIKLPPDGDFQGAYESAFEKQCGYLPEHRAIEVVTARVVATVSRPNEQSLSHHAGSTRRLTPSLFKDVFFNGKRIETSVFERPDLSAGDIVTGPAIVTEAISTIVVDPGWQAECLTNGELLLTRTQTATQRFTGTQLSSADPVLLEVFNKRFAAIATQMGSTLRKNARSVNIKERLDYSCAIFTSEGNLVVNAPHIPVHLGAMGATVRHALDQFELNRGDVIVTNDPYHGGSHLPDVTVISPVHDADGSLLFLTTSRAHHAEIGGIAPGSMPAFSTNLAEEGVLIRATRVIDRGKSRLSELKTLLTSGPNPSRNPGTNLADIQAQIAANKQGADSLLDFVADCSWPVVSSYMQFIQDAAARKTRNALAKLPDGERQFVDHLDDGSRIQLSLRIESGTATLDFTGTSEVLPGNLNANPAIVTAATLYCMRLLISEDIPLNAGVLEPIHIKLPVCLLNPPPHSDPAKCPAIVGGNVETSQRVVDVILGALGIAAASQGTMNNFLFGNESFGYYETICGGSGASATGQGADAVHTHMTNTRLTDPEIMERRFPVRVRSFSIRSGSGGAGQHHGGDGVIREIEFLKPLHVSLVTQRRGQHAPYGLAEGEAGTTGANTLVREDGQIVVLEGIASVEVEPGDMIRIETPGGGGWGSPG